MTTTSSLNSIVPTLALQSPDELVEPLVAFLDAVLHPVLDHRVAGLDRLEQGGRPDEGPTVAAVHELERVHGHVARCTEELERLDELVGRRLAVEHATEGELGARVRVGVHVAPAAAVADVQLLDAHPV